MVDMVEARKRAKSKRKEDAEVVEKLTGPQPVPPQTKPVLRSERTVQEVSNYFPVESFVSEKEKGSVTRPGTLLPKQVSTAAVPEDQVDFLQRLLEEEVEEEEADKLLEAPPEEREVLIFQLGKERYGMDINQIAEIIRFVEPTEVPHTVGFLDGIISLRGRMIPVINGRKRLGHEPILPGKRTRIIVLNDNGELHGVMVDSASQVVRLPKKDIEPTPPVVVGIDAEFIEGVCEYKTQLVILLNLERFLRLV